MFDTDAARNDYFLNDALPKLQTSDTRVIMKYSVGGTSFEPVIGSGDEIAAALRALIQTAEIFNTSYSYVIDRFER